MRDRRLQRALDLIGGGLLLVLTGPLLLLAGLAVLITSGRPVLHRQERLGRDGRPFDLWKLRTMIRDAEAGTGPVVAGRGDPRQTAVGRVLRRLAIDELPQLWNVLRGEMSLVGPRPERPAIARRIEEEVPRFAERLAVRPGLTGPAQVRGLRGRTDVRRRLELDLAYIDGWWIGRDLAILCRTPLALLRSPVEVAEGEFPGEPDAGPGAPEPVGEVADRA